MRCRRAVKLVGPFLDGELGARETQMLQRHLETCPGCRGHLAEMKSLLAGLSRLPQLVPTTAERTRLLARIRKELVSPSPRAVPSTFAPRARIAAVAIAAVTALGIGVTWVLVGSRPPLSPQGDTAPGEVIQNLEGEEDRLALDYRKGAEITGSGAAEAPMLAYPTVVASGKEYSGLDLRGFNQDVAPRLSFYSAYWLPQAEGSQAARMDSLREALLEELASRAERAGLDPESLRRAVAAVMERVGEEDLLPCYAEMARVEGRDAWLISLSGPEDYLLFSDPSLPATMHLVVRGGEETLRLNEALLRELAGRLAPHISISAPAAGGAEPAPTAGEGSPETVPGDVTAPSERQTAAEETSEEAMMADFQAFLEELAARGTNLHLLSVLQDLNYDQLILLLQGDWAALAREGVDLTELITPPSRLWAVEAATGEIIWSPR